MTAEQQLLHRVGSEQERLVCVCVCVCVCVLIYLTKCHYTFSTLLVNLAGVGEVGDGGWQELECWYN